MFDGDIRVKMQVHNLAGLLSPFVSLSQNGIEPSVDMIDRAF